MNSNSLFSRPSELTPASLPLDKENVVIGMDSGFRRNDREISFCRSRVLRKRILLRRKSGNPGFTLIELLIVIAIIAILSIVVVLTLSPAEMLRQSRDATRISDLDTLNRALGLYVTDMATQGGMLYLGNASTVYISLIDSSSTCGSLGLPALPAGYGYHCSSASSSRATDGNGWLPVPIKNITSGSPLGSLPIDPTNQSSTNLYYTYQTDGSKYLLTAFFESTKYAKSMASGGSDPALYALGSNLSLPSLGRGLVGYWPMDEGGGSVTQDMSGWGDNGTLVCNGAGCPTWATGRIGSNAISIITSSSPAQYPSIYLSPITSFALNTFSLGLWINPTSNGGYVFADGFNTAVCNGTSTSGWGIAINNFSYCDGTDVGRNFSIPSQSLGSWHHFVITVSAASQVNIYVDTVNVLSTTISGFTYTSAPIIRMGQQANVGNGMAGLLDDVRLYNRVLSAAEVQALYNAEK